jgi:hypothetical protein
MAKWHYYLSWAGAVTGLQMVDCSAEIPFRREVNRTADPQDCCSTERGQKNASF